MKPRHNLFLGSLLVVATAIGLATVTHAANLTWDADTVTTGAQDGGGTWTAGGAGWWNGTTSANANWTNGDVATFGSGSAPAAPPVNYAVTLGSDVIVGNLGSTPGDVLLFNNPGNYTFSATNPQTLRINNSGTATAYIRLAKGVTTTIGDNVKISRASSSSNGQMNFYGGATSGSTDGGTLLIGSGTFGGNAVLENLATNLFEFRGGITVEIKTGGTFSSRGSVVLGMSTTGNGLEANMTNTFKVSGGSASIGETTTNTNFVIGNNTGTNATTSTGIVTISAGSLIINPVGTGSQNNGIRFGTNSSTNGYVANGIFNLDGGVVTTALVYEGTVSNSAAINSTFNFNGGELRVLTNSANASKFMTGLNTARVRGGGAKINTNGVNTTIGQALLTSDIDGANFTDGGLEKRGAGTLTLTGANTYNGATTVSAGTLVADTTTNATVLSSSSALVMKGGTFQLKGAAAASRSQILNGLDASSGASVVDVNNLGTSTTLDLRGSGGSLTIDRIAGATVDFKATAGTLGTTSLILPGTTNTNGILGAWATVNGGTDFAANSTNTSSGYVVAATSTGGNLGDGGQAADSAMNFKPSDAQTGLTSAKSFNTLNFSGAIGATMTGSGALTVAGGGLIYNSTGAITGGTLAGSASGELVLHTAQALSLDTTAIIDNGGDTALTKSGSASLTLGDTNTYTGATNISQGTLVIGAGGSIANSSTIQIASGASLDVSAVSGFTVGSDQTLVGTGTVKGNLDVDGTLSIGNSPGTMTFDGNLTMESGSESNFEINGFSTGNYDLAVAAAVGSQTVTFNGGILNLLFASGFSTPGSVKIFDFDAYAGTGFTSLESSGLAAGYTATFDASNGIVTVIPEPRAALLGGLATLLLLRRRRVGK